MLIKHYGIKKNNFNKASLFTDYSKTSNNLKQNLGKYKINIEKDKCLTFSKKNFLNQKCNTVYSMNVKTYKNPKKNNNTDINNIKLVNKKSRTYSNFYYKKNNNNNVRTRNNNIINIINLSKISSLYGKRLYSTSNTHNYALKPELPLKPKKTEFNSLEKYILKATNRVNEIKHEYKPNLEEFYINKQLQNYITKSKSMIHAKDDLNILYKDSHMLNNICDYVSNALFKLRIKKRNNIKEIKKELKRMKNENMHKKIMNMKMSNQQIPMEKLYTRKKYDSTNNIEINPKLKAPLIYQNCYAANNIKYLFDRFYYKKQLNSMLKNNKMELYENY